MAKQNFSSVSQDPSEIILAPQGTFLSIIINIDNISSILWRKAYAEKYSNIKPFHQPLDLLHASLPKRSILNKSTFENGLSL